MKILVTGGCGYIGSHTIVDLIDHGFEVISVDNYSRSQPRMFQGIKDITGIEVQNYPFDLCNAADTKKIFQEHPDIQGIIHFAAYKSVPESVAAPLLYYHNNLQSLLNLLNCVEEYQIPYFVFSSSCSVYGNAQALPVTEATPFEPAESPYGHTKQMGEDIIRHFAKAQQNNNILLRYFNPVGAHLSAKIGEYQEKPENLVPVITQTAIGKREKMAVYGTDYPTRDGSCVRDYIHVMDIANAHTKAIEYLIAKKNNQHVEVFNLGLGEGVTVLEAINAFERSTGEKLNYELGERRAGDVIAIYSDNQKAIQELGWQPQYSIDQMMSSAWEWEKNLQLIKQENLA